MIPFSCTGAADCSFDFSTHPARKTSFPQPFNLVQPGIVDFFHSFINEKPRFLLSGSSAEQLITQIKQPIENDCLDVLQI
jgi:hypothetical protein